MANIVTSRALTQLTEAELETRVRNIRALADSHEQFVQSRIDEQRKYLALLKSPPRKEVLELASPKSQTPHKNLVEPNVRQLHTSSPKVTSEIEQLIEHRLSTEPDPRYRLLNQHEAALKAELDSKSSELEKVTEALREARADANLQEERAAAQKQEHQFQIKKWKRFHEIALGDESPTNRLQAMGHQLEQLQDALAEKNSELQEAKLHAANGRQIIKQQQGALQKLEPQVSSLEYALATLIGEKDSTNAECKRLVDALAEVEEQLQMLKARWSQYRSDVEVEVAMIDSHIFTTCRIASAAVEDYNTEDEAQHVEPVSKSLGFYEEDSGTQDEVELTAPSEASRITISDGTLAQTECGHDADVVYNNDELHLSALESRRMLDLSREENRPLHALNVKKSSPAKTQSHLNSRSQLTPIVRKTRTLSPPGRSATASFLASDSTTQKHSAGIIREGVVRDVTCMPLINTEMAESLHCTRA